MSRRWTQSLPTSFLVGFYRKNLVSLTLKPCLKNRVLYAPAGRLACQLKFNRSFCGLLYVGNKRTCKNPTYPCRNIHLACTADCLRYSSTKTASIDNVLSFKNPRIRKYVSSLVEEFNKLSVVEGEPTIKQKELFIMKPMIMKVKEYFEKENDIKELSDIIQGMVSFFLYNIIFYWSLRYHMNTESVRDTL